MSFKIESCWIDRLNRYEVGELLGFVGCKLERLLKTIVCNFRPL